MSDVRVTGQLRIVVLKARNLQNRRKLEKQNPYVTLRIGHIVEHTSVDYRGGQTPQWDDESKFELTPDLEPLLQLSILDETKKTPTLIAEKKIDITPAFAKPPNIGYDSWYQVEYAGREAGEIFLEMTFYPTAPQVPLKIPIKNRMIVGRNSSARPLPTIPGDPNSTTTTLQIPTVLEEMMAQYKPRYAEDILVKSFSSSLINNRRQSPAPVLLETIPLDNSDRHNLSNSHLVDEEKNHDLEGFNHNLLKNSKTETDLKENLTTDLNLLFIGSESEANGRGKVGEFSGFKKLATKFHSPDFQNNINTTTPMTTGNLFKKRSFLSSPKKHFLSKFGNQFLQQQQQSKEDDFDLLEQQVQSDWEQNHPNEFQDAINRRFGNKLDNEEKEKEEDKTSSWTRSISSLNKNKFLEVPSYMDDNDDDYDDDEESEDDDMSAPPPPPKSNNSSRSGNSLFSTYRSVESSDYGHILESHLDQFKLKTQTKPTTLHKPRFSDLNNDNELEIEIEIPYSADSIGVNEMNLKKKQQRLPDLPNGKKNDEIIQSKYHAPKPDELLARKFRLESGAIKEGDLEIEPGLGDYKGSGEWGENNNSFSPSRFKPKVPAKVPIGLSKEEYYIIDRKNYLKDLNGRRE